jgi:uncharacterized protein
MSQENVEVVRRAWQALARRDNEAAFALYDPEVEIDLTGSGFPGAGVYHGLEGVRSWNREWLGAFGGFSADVEEWIDAGEQVIAMVRWHGRGKLSGTPAQMLRAHVWTLRDGKLLRLRIYDDKATALEAAGLRE